MSRQKSNLSRIKQSARLLRFITQVAMFLMPLVLPALWLCYDQLPPLMKQKMFDACPASIPTTHKILGVLSSLPSAFFLFFMLRAMTRLLRLYADGTLFELENARALRSAALFLLLNTLYGILFLRPLSTVVLTLSNPPGQRALSFGFSSSDLTALFACAFLYLTAWVALEAHTLKSDSDLTI